MVEGVVRDKTPLLGIEFITYQGNRVGSIYLAGQMQTGVKLGSATAVDNGKSATWNSLQPSTKTENLLGSLVAFKLGG